MAKSPEQCRDCAVSFSWQVLVINAALGILKAVVGVIAGSKALLASALYSINDVLSATVTIISVRVARRPPDAVHPYGYGKAEFIAIGIVSTIVAGAVIYVLTHSVYIILRGVTAPPHFVALLVAMLAAVANELLARRGFCAARETQSQVVWTSAEHNHADAESSVAAIIGISGALMGLHWLDPLVAIFETAHLSWLCGRLFGHAIRGLMDPALDTNTMASLDNACGSVKGVTHVAELRSRQLGGYAWVDAEVEVDANIVVEEADHICQEVRRIIRATLGPRTYAQVSFRSTRLLAEAPQ